MGLQLVLKNLKYDQGKGSTIDIDEPQSLLLVGDVITLALANAGFTAEIEAQNAK